MSKVSMRSNRWIIAGRCALYALAAFGFVCAVGISCAVMHPLPSITHTRANTQRASLHILAAAIEAYRMDAGDYPATEQGLAALLCAPLDHPRPNDYQPGGYIRRDQAMIDAWGNELVYRRSEGGAFSLMSFGADGAEGGEGLNDDLVVSSP